MMTYEELYCAVAELALALHPAGDEVVSSSLGGWAFHAYVQDGRTMAKVAGLSTPLDCEAASAARRMLCPPHPLEHAKEQREGGAQEAVQAGAGHL